MTGLVIGGFPSSVAEETIFLLQSATTRSMASKSSISTASLSFRAANSAASFTTFARSA
jgi:hypothetical protein